MKPNRKEIIMGKKRNCRMTDEEKKMHERAIKLRKIGKLHSDGRIAAYVSFAYW
jgi:hypothetical protein